MRGLAFGPSPKPKSSWSKSNSRFRLPVTLSKLPAMRGSCQLSSMNLVIEVWLVRVWSTWFFAAHGEMTSRGSRGP